MSRFAVRWVRIDADCDDGVHRHPPAGGSEEATFVDAGRPEAYYASLPHDALCQFLGAGLPMSRTDADEVFVVVLTRDGSAPRGLHCAAERVFGGVFRLFTRWKHSYRGARRVPAAAAAPTPP